MRTDERKNASFAQATACQVTGRTEEIKGDARMPALFLSTIQWLTRFGRTRRRKSAGCYVPESLEPRLVLSALALNAQSLNPVESADFWQTDVEHGASDGGNFSSGQELDSGEFSQRMGTLDEFFADSHAGLFSLTDDSPLTFEVTAVSADHTERDSENAPAGWDGTGSEQENVRLPQAVPYPVLAVNSRQIALLESLFQGTAAPGTGLEKLDAVLIAPAATASMTWKRTVPDAVLGVSSPHETKRLLVAGNDAVAPAASEGVPSESTGASPLTVTGQRRRDVLNSLFERQGSPSTDVLPASATERPATPADADRTANPEFLPMDAVIPADSPAAPPAETPVPDLFDGEIPDEASAAPLSVDDGSIAPGAFLAASTLALIRKRSWTRRLRNLRRWVFHRC